MVTQDPTEHEDRSSSEPALVAKLLGMLEEAQKGVYSVDRGLVDPASVSNFSRHLINISMFRCMLHFVAQFNQRE